MNKKTGNESRTDDLLKKILKDDLPADVEGRMKAQFTQFQENVVSGKGFPAQIFGHRWRDFLKLNWAVRKEVLAFSSLVMIIIGAFLHLSGHRSAVAETLSFLNTSVSVAAQIENASSMECRIQLPSENELSQTYTIRWVSPEMTRVDVFEKDKASKTLQISGSEISVNDHVNNSFRKFQSLEDVKDPVWQPVLEFLTPSVLSSAIYEKWKPQHSRVEIEGQKTTYVFLCNGERTTLEMTVDMNTSLPLSIRKYTFAVSGVDDVYELALEALFIWNQPVSLMKISDKDGEGGKNGS